MRAGRAAPSRAAPGRAAPSEPRVSSRGIHQFWPIETGLPPMSEPRARARKVPEIWRSDGGPQRNLRILRNLLALHAGAGGISGS